MKALLKLIWAGVMVAACLGVLIVVGGISISTTVTQESVTVALGIAVAVIPYVFARALSEIVEK